MNRAAMALTLVLCGCSQPTEAELGCATAAPSQLGSSCSGDGECGNWLVCDDACELPPAVSGEGGVAARLTDGTDPVELRVEVARSDIARSRGLGNRPCIADGWGLVIEFPEPGDHLITTQSMRFAIDLAMVGEDGIIHTVHLAAPPGGKALYGAEWPVSRVLEMAADTLEVAPGSRLEYE